MNHQFYPYQRQVIPFHQIVQDVMNGQPVKKAAKTRAKSAGKSVLQGAIQDITQQGRGRKVLKRKRKATPASS